MAREDHQPIEGPVEHRNKSVGEMRALCNSFPCIILALDEGIAPLTVQFEDPELEPVTCVNDDAAVARPLQNYEGKPCVTWAVESALEAGFAGVAVLAVPSLIQAIEDAVRRDASDNARSVRIIAYDNEAGRRKTRDACGFQLFGLGFGLLDEIRRIACEIAPACTRIAVLGCDQVRMDAQHLSELCEDAIEQPDVDAVSSWIMWFRHKPFVISRSFLDGLASSTLVEPGSNGIDRPLPRLRVHDHVFGEEKLSANAAGDPRSQAFAEQMELSAQQAVSLARIKRENPDEPLVIPGKPASRLAMPRPHAIEGADASLVDAATAIAEKVSSLSPDDATELAWADAFAKRCRLDFPLLNDRAHKDSLTYLDSAATAQRCAQALQAQRDFDMHENANVYRGSYELSLQATFTLNDARARLESFIGSTRRSTIFTANTTAAVNLVAQAWGTHHIGPGDLVVCSLPDHHSNIMPFLMLAERVGAHLEYIPYDESGRLDQQAYARLLDERPKLICLTQVGNTLGIEAPIRHMADTAHKAGARVLVDAAQSFPHVAIDVTDLGADWIAFSGHKAYGPLGIGGLWVSDDAFAEMDPIAGGGGTVSHVATDSYYLRAKAIQYELGTPPISQAVGFAAALDYLDALGMENVHRHDAALTRYLVDGLHAIPGITVVGDHSREDGWMGLVSFSLYDEDTSSLAAFLGGLGIAVRSGSHCAQPLHSSLGLSGTVRASMGVYTTRDDIDALLTGLEMYRRLHNRAK